MDRLNVNLDLLKAPHGRDTFLKGLLGGVAGIAGMTMLGSTVASAATSTATVPASDIAILNYALTLEHIEADFYATALKYVPFQSPGLKDLARVIRNDENTHVTALTAAIQQLGGTPVAAARVYDFGNGTFASEQSFLALSEALEDTGVHAYLGAAGLIKTPSILLTAASIVTVEARHAGAIRTRRGQSPTVGAFDTGLSQAAVLKIAGPFIKQM